MPASTKILTDLKDLIYKNTVFITYSKKKKKTKSYH